MKNNKEYLVELISSQSFRFELGSGKLREIYKFLEGKDILLVTSRGFTKRNITDGILKHCKGFNIEILDSVEPNPTLDSVDFITKKFKKSKFSSIIALGGGSAIDTAKALAVSLNQKADINMNKIFREKKDIKIDFALPIIAIPTTSGTGSEVTQYATIWDSKYKKKYSLESNYIKPRAVILDPELTISLSNEKTLFPALDSISHSLESIWNINSDESSITFATESLKLSSNILPKILKNPNDIENRLLMQLSSLLAGLAISKTKTALAHSISYPLTSHFEIPHGLASSFSLVSIYKYVKENTDFKFPEASTILQTINILSELNLAEKILNFASKKQIEGLQDEMFSSERAQNFAYSISDDNLKDIIRSSLNH